MNQHQRRIIFHYHIYKNAGSTVDYILENKFGSRWRKIEADQPWSVLDAEELRDYSLSNPSIEALSSHTARLTLARCDHLKLYPVLFLRHPIDRIASVFLFEKRRNFEGLGLPHELSKSTSFSDYVRWRFELGNGCVISNFQTIYLSGRETDMRVAECQIQDRLRASEVLNALPCFGLVERFDSSLDLISNKLEIDLRRDCLSQNVSGERSTELSARIEAVESELGKTLFEEVVERNSHDISLYNEARERFFQLSER